MADTPAKYKPHEQHFKTAPDTPEKYKPHAQPVTKGATTPKNGEIGQPARAKKPPLPTVPVKDANYYGKESTKRI